MSATLHRTFNAEMFCTTLRKRLEWASVPANLLSQQQPRWQEQTLGTHDLAIPIPQPRGRDRKELFRIILLSSADIHPPENAMGRIERLYHQTGGRHVGIVFFIKNNNSPENSTRALMKLQAGPISMYGIPILPLYSVQSLQSTLLAFQRQIVQTQTAPPPQRIDSINALLPFCSVNGPIPEHARNILSDICHSIPEVAQAASTRDGQEGIKQWLTEPPQLVGDIIGFWEQEYIVD